MPMKNQDLKGKAIPVAGCIIFPQHYGSVIFSRKCLMTFCPSQMLHENIV
jgi:hypothetical protein